MHKNKYYKPPKPATLPQKQLDTQSRPDFTTDFTDHEKYKLSQLQMIQKKASLQSKNRELAKQDLQQRRKKLEMGIVDDETRRIYETALTSKRIDLNPSIRRNLSQMIQYQKENKERDRSARRNNSRNSGSKSKNRSCQRQAQNSEEQNQSQGFQEKIKETQHFIKKLERSKKQGNINRAVQMLLNDKTSQNFGPTKNQSQNQNSKSQTFLKSDKNSFNIKQEINQSRFSTISQQQTLSNIQQTIKYMQQKLFNPSWKKSVQPNQNKKTTIQATNKDIKNSTISQISHENSQNQFLQNLQNLPSGRINTQSSRMINSNTQLGFTSPISTNNNYKILNKNNQNTQQHENSSFDMQQQLEILKLNFNMNTDFSKFQNLHKNQLKIQQNVNNRMYKNNPKFQLQHYNQYEQDDCLATIRKMKDMMESQAYLYDNADCHKSKQNKNIFNTQRSHNTYRTEGDKEVDFSLTLNQDQIQIHNKQVCEDNNYQSKNNHNYKENNKNIGKYVQNNTKISKNNKNINYQEMKKSLFQQIDQFQKQINQNSSYYSNKSRINTPQQNNLHNNYPPHSQQQQQQQHQMPVPSQYKFSKQPENQPIFHNNSPKISSNTKKLAIQSKFPTKILSQHIQKQQEIQTYKINNQLQQLKSLVHGAKNNVSNIKIGKLGGVGGLGEGGNGKGSNGSSVGAKNNVMGFDYRGSINIKKHIVQQHNG